MSIPLTYLIFLNCLFCIPTCAYAEIENNWNSTSSNGYPFEKIYLHTDRDNYFPGDTLWLKVYLVDAANNFPSASSNNLYAELISPKGELIERHILYAENGFAVGDFPLGDTLTNGTYQLRSYTNYMRNFDPGFFFTKNITITNPLIAQNQIVSSKTEQEKAQDAMSLLDLQFLPEGGSLVTDVNCKVAFRATLSGGIPTKVKGVIEDNKGKQYTSFNSVHNGMGFFMLKPDKGKTYFARLKNETGNKSYSLPLVQITGTVLSIIAESSGSVLVKTKQNPKRNKKQKYRLLIQTNGIVHKEVTIPHQKFFHTLRIKKDELPTGIVCFTLYNENDVPEAERIYFNSPNEKLEISIATDKTVYQPREKVTLLLETTIDNKAVPANFSLAVTDLFQLPEQAKYAENIASYFLLSSELKGTIHESGYYFDKNAEDAKQYLDLVMLTHGWRKYCIDENEELDFQAEKGFEVSGKVTRLFGKKPLSNHKVDLTVWGYNIQFLSARTNNKGEFRFNNLYLQDSNRVVVHSSAKKGKSRGELELYKNEPTFPQIVLPLKLQANSFQKEGRPIDELTLAAIRERYINDNIYKHVDIEEVKVTSKKKEYKSRDDDEYLYASASAGDKVYEIPDKFYYSSIEQLVSFTLPPPPPRIEILKDSIKYYCNNDRMFYDQVNTLNPENISKIVYISNHSSTMALLGAYNGAIMFYTKKGGDVIVNKINPSAKKYIASGYYHAKEFYQPKYDTLKEDDKPDLRRTVHWEPNITTGKDGLVKITFYTTDRVSRFRVNVEGIFYTGQPGVSEFQFETGKK